MGLEKVPLRQVDTNVVYTFSYTGNLVQEPVPHRLYNDSGLNRKITGVRASLGSPAEGAPASVYVKLNGSTNVTGVVLAAGTYTQLISNLSFNWPSGEYLTVEIAGIGSSLPGADLTINVVVSE